MINFIKRVKSWIAIDGLLHFLVCYAMMLALSPIIGIGWATTVTFAFALGKEVYDVFIQKDNNYEQAGHDIICDLAGYFAALLTMLIWYLV